METAERVRHTHYRAPRTVGCVGGKEEPRGARGPLLVTDKSYTIRTDASKHFGDRGRADTPERVVAIYRNRNSRPK